MDNISINESLVNLKSTSSPGSIREEHFFQAWQKQLESAKWWVADNKRNNQQDAQDRQQTVVKEQQERVNNNKFVDQNNNLAKHGLTQLTSARNSVSTEHNSEQFIQQLIKKQDGTIKYVFDKTMVFSNKQEVSKNQINYLERNNEVYSAYSLKAEDKQNIRIYVSSVEEGLNVNIVGQTDSVSSEKKIAEQVMLFNQQSAKRVLSIKINGRLVYEDTSLNMKIENKNNATELNRLY